jgi:hypothetical protein
MEVFGIRPMIRHQAFEPCSRLARVPVRIWRASRSGRTGALASSLAGVVLLAYGIPAEPVRLRIRMPWPSAKGNPPPLPG